MPMTNTKKAKQSKLTNLKRGYRLCHKLAPSYIGRQCFSESVKNVLQYAGIYLSGIIVSMITGDMELKPVVTMLLVYAMLNLILGVSGEFIMRSKSEQLEKGFAINAKMLLAKKCAAMDYVRVENPETHRMKQEAENYLYGTGSRYLGIGQIFYNTHIVFRGVFSCLVGIGMCFSTLFMKHSNTGGFLGFIQSVPAVLLLFFIYAILIFVQLKSFDIVERKTSAFYSDKGYNREGRIVGFYMDFFRNRYQRGKEIRLYNQSELLLKEWEKHNDAYQSYGKKVLRNTFLLDMVSPVILFLLYAFTYLFFIVRAVSGMYNAAETVVLIMSITKILNDLIMILGGIMVEFQIAAGNIGRIFDFLDISDEKYRGTIPTEKRNDNKYEFEFCHVSFRYPNSDRYVLQDISLTWRVGEKMALVGRNGSGKSTLVKLLCRLYEPTEGVITLNGVDIRKYNYEEYMALFSVVFQDSRLFSFSIAENVAADTGYDSARVMECVKRAGLGERLSKMPDGIETCLYKDFDEKGVEISGGEAQKLCLARAVYKSAPFIILDEPTAALDPVAEHDIYTKFDSIVGTRTAIYISHRLSSCRFCDDIVVLEDGRIVEQGNHKALLNQEGIYAALWSAQAEYYKDTAGELFA